MDRLGGWRAAATPPSDQRLRDEARSTSAREQEMADESSDSDLIAALRAGEEWAALRLYERVNEVVVRTLTRLLRSRRELIEDLTQSTFEKMIRYLNERSIDARSNVRAWASTVATHVAIDYLRRELSERKLFVASEYEPPDRAVQGSLETGLDSRAELRKLQRIIAMMDPKYAETVLLHDVLGHELSEIAASMGVSVAAAQSRLVRGRKDLLRRCGRGQP